MDQQERYCKALRNAAQTLGGEARLSTFLRVEPEQVESWLSGLEVPPLAVFLASLDVIADGPYAQQRSVRVAVIRPQADERSQS